MSIVLFNFSIDQILREWYTTQPKGIEIEVGVADNQVVMAGTEDVLQRAVNNLVIMAQRHNMKM